MNMTDEKAAIIKWLMAYPNCTSFVEIQKLPGCSGENWIGADENLLVWIGLSAVAANTIIEMLKDGLIAVQPTTILVYMCDGRTLNLPVAKSSTYKYKKPHWLPSVILTTPKGEKAFSELFPSPAPTPSLKRGKRF